VAAQIVLSRLPRRLDNVSAKGSASYESADHKTAQHRGNPTRAERHSSRFDVVPARKRPSCISSVQVVKDHHRIPRSGSIHLRNEAAKLVSRDKEAELGQSNSKK